MAGRRLVTYVHVEGVAYGPDDEVPAEVAERITAPGVWSDEVAAEEDAGEPAPKRSRTKAGTASDSSSAEA